MHAFVPTALAPSPRPARSIASAVTSRTFFGVPLARSAPASHLPSHAQSRYQSPAPPRASLAAPLTARVSQYYRSATVPSAAVAAARRIFGPDVELRYETCFNVGGGEGKGDGNVLEWLLAETFEEAGSELSRESAFGPAEIVVEVGPRLNFQTAWSANAVSICRACGVEGVERLERSRRYKIIAPAGGDVAKFGRAVCDRMTEVVYDGRLESFDSGMRPVKAFQVDVVGKGRAALDEVNEELGLGFDEYDIQLYLKLFGDDMHRNPTNVELFDLAQSNSEHSRHWFFKGRLVIDGEEAPEHLFDVVRGTLKANPRNSVIAFADNSSTIRGGDIPVLLPAKPGEPSAFDVVNRDRDILFTAETHNFPSGVAPFPGAETGAGGRIRDTAATGRGSLVAAGTAGYSVGNLGMGAEWEDEKFLYPSNLASPLEILIGASNGASDYGNKFGEPVINGFARTYGQRLPSGERREYVKPIMFSGGMGTMDHSHSEKEAADVGLWVVKVGGPAYRIGMGGGSASSMMQGDNRDDLDFNAVQRGDAEMEQKAYRVLRTCVEMGDDNPIVSIHDQGAGGNCNVVKELIYPAGAKIDLRKVWVGDSSLSALEIWGAEYQEQFGLLLRPESREMFVAICKRENVVPAFLGKIDGSGRIVLWDEEVSEAVVDLDLEAVLGDLPQKTFEDKRVAPQLKALELPAVSTAAGLQQALDRVLTLMTVGSKRFLTSKVDRSVSGLVAQQQCVGSLQLPLADFGLLARSYFDIVGSVTAIGERPTLTALSPAAMARMSVAEMMTNIAGALVTDREDIKCEANWMWAAKLPGDAASIYDAAHAMSDAMIELGIAVDGGKDSLSMAARCPVEGQDAGETVRAPGTLVVTGYCSVPDVSRKATPDIKLPGRSTLLHIDIAAGRRRLGGSCIAQVFNQLGDECPDLDDVKVLAAAFDTVQSLLREGSSVDVLAYHDVSDGGLLTTVLEMAFGGNCGVDISIPDASVGSFFAEELGMVIEVANTQVDACLAEFKRAGVPCGSVATTRFDSTVDVCDGLLVSSVQTLRDTWERTAFALERLQAAESAVREEQDGLSTRKGLSYHVPWSPKATDMTAVATLRHKVAIIREEGSNGDREMTAAFHLSGFEAWDVSMRDISSGSIDLSQFRGAVFVGGFSYADVLDSAKGWAGVMRFNEVTKKAFDLFYARVDTFSLGVCNGCQLMALLGRVPFGPDDLLGSQQPRFIQNKSDRFESRFSSVLIDGSTPSIMLKGMGGARLGVWSAHGEGRAYFPDQSVLSIVESESLVPLRYVDDEGEVTMAYPHNPNGSQSGIAGLCSRDGRHLAMMPHPERAILKWQWAYLPSDLDEDLEVSPWLTMFQAAHAWCTETESE